MAFKNPTLTSFLLLLLLLSISFLFLCLSLTSQHPSDLDAKLSLKTSSSSSQQKPSPSPSSSSSRRSMIGSMAPICTYNECRGCRFKCTAEQVPVDANDPMNSAYHYRCVCHR